MKKSIEVEVEITPHDLADGILFCLSGDDLAKMLNSLGRRSHLLRLALERVRMSNVLGESGRAALEQLGSYSKIRIKG